MATDTEILEPREIHGEARHSPPEAPSPADAGEISLLDLILVLVRRRRMILAVTAASLILSMIVAFLLPNEYTATVILLPPQQGSSLAAALSSQLSSLGAIGALAGGSLGIKNPNDMFVSMFKSPIVEDAMVKQFGLMREYRKRYLSQARKKFEHYSDVDGSGKDGLIRVSVEDRSPQRAALMANSYVDQFRDLSQHLAITEASQRRLFFQGQMEQAKDQLAQAEQALKQTEQSTGLIALNAQAEALISSAATLRAQIAAKEVQIQALRTFATGDNSQLIEARQELDSLQAQLDQLGGSQQNPNSLIVPRGQVPQAGLEYARRLRDVKYYETIFDILARQYELAKLDEAREGALIQVVSPALVPDRKSFPPRLLIILGATILGFLAAGAMALTQAGWARLKEDPEASLKLSLIQEELCSGKTQRS